MNPALLKLADEPFEAGESFFVAERAYVLRAHVLMYFHAFLDEGSPRTPVDGADWKR